MSDDTLRDELAELLNQCWCHRDEGRDDAPAEPERDCPSHGDRYATADALLPVIIADRQRAVDQALQEAARRGAVDLEMDEGDAAGHYMTVVHGGDTDRGAVWGRAYAFARSLKGQS